MSQHVIVMNTTNPHIECTITQTLHSVSAAIIVFQLETDRFVIPMWDYRQSCAMRHFKQVLAVDMRCNNDYCISYTS